jgi:Raf kinase inhibitor-like YbhB/YbcL family protein
MLRFVALECQIFSAKGRGFVSFELRSSAFQQNLSIPTKYTCDGANVSVPLSWRDAPPATKSFALIVDDPDAPSGIWVHWVLYDLPASSHALGEAIPNQGTLGNGTKQGVNDFGKVGYAGPCPPRGPAHRYFFKLYALVRVTELKPSATKQQLLQAMKEHILAEVELVGTYKHDVQF